MIKLTIMQLERNGRHFKASVNTTVVLICLHCGVQREALTNFAQFPSNLNVRIYAQIFITLTVIIIDGFHRDVIKFSNQNREVFWTFTHFRLKMT